MDKKNEMTEAEQRARAMLVMALGMVATVCTDPKDAARYAQLAVDEAEKIDCLLPGTSG